VKSSGTEAKLTVHSVNGKTKMLPKVIEILTRRILMDILNGEKASRGVITFEHFDYVVNIRRVSKRRWSNLFGLHKPAE
jgi:hypothetical protein